MKKMDISFSKALGDYVLSSLRESDVLKRLREETDSDPYAIMQIPPEQGHVVSDEESGVHWIRTPLPFRLRSINL